MVNGNRLLREAKLFDAKLGQIDGVGNVGAYLIQLAEGKQVMLPQTDAQLQSGVDAEQEGEDCGGRCRRSVRKQCVC